MTYQTLNFGGKRGRPRKEKGPKLPFGVSSEFVEEIAAASTEVLKAKIVTMQKDLDEVITFLKTDTKLEELKNAVKEVEGPSRDTKKSLNNRTKLVINGLRERGAL